MTDLYPSDTPRVGLAVASVHGGSIMMTSNCAAAASALQSYVVTLAWIGTQCGGTWRCGGFGAVYGDGGRQQRVTRSVARQRLQMQCCQ